jgi:hypothetical protein
MCISPTKFWMSEPVFMKLGMYVMAPAPVLTAYLINTVNLCVCVCVCVCVFEFVLRLTDSRPIHLGIVPPVGALDQILSLFSANNYLILLSKASSVTRKRVCSLQCNHSLVRLLTPNNHTLPSHLRLFSLFVASYDSQGLRWRYSNPPPHVSLKTKFLLSHI